MKTFEQYLEDRCFELHPEVLDDDKPDFFDNWLGDSSNSALIMYAGSWGRHIKSHILREVTNLTK